jgi:hypothetical protein
MPQKHPRRGLTRMELIVIIAVCAVLLGLLIPAILAVRENSRKQTCINNLKQIGLGLHNYHDSRKCFPGSAQMVGKKPNQKPGGWSFLFFLIPLVDWDSIPQEFRINPVFIKSTIAFDDKLVVDPLTSNDPGIQHNRNQPMFVECICPSNPNKTYEDPVNKQVLFTSYKALGATSAEKLTLSADPNAIPPYDDAKFHPDGALYPTNSGIRSSDISDGLSHTVMVVETIDDTKSCWLAGADATLVGMPNAKSYQSFTDKTGSTFDAPLDYNGLFYGGATPALQAMQTYLSFDFRPDHADAGTYPAGVGRTPAYGPSSSHPGIVNHLFCDGSVKSIRKDIDYAAYFFLITRANGDTSVSASDY